MSDTSITFLHVLQLFTGVDVHGSLLLLALHTLTLFRHLWGRCIDSHPPVHITGTRPYRWHLYLQALGITAGQIQYSYQVVPLPLLLLVLLPTLSCSVQGVARNGKNPLSAPSRCRG